MFGSLLFQQCLDVLTFSRLLCSILLLSSLIVRSSWCLFLNSFFVSRVFCTILVLNLNDLFMSIFVLTCSHFFLSSCAILNSLLVCSNYLVVLDVKSFSYLYILNSPNIPSINFFIVISIFIRPISTHWTSLVILWVFPYYAEDELFLYIHI